jgi:thiol-disulfide isomerase/thioredoxin
MKFLKSFNLPLVAIVFFASIVAATVFILYSRKSNDITLVAAKRLEGQRLPSSTLNQINEDNFFVVYLTSSCGHCSDEADLLSELNASSPQLRIFGVMAENEPLIKEYVLDHQIKFPVLADRNLDMLRDLKLEFFPTNLKIEKGVIKRAYLGVPENKEKLLTLISD